MVFSTYQYYTPTHYGIFCYLSPCLTAMKFFYKAKKQYLHPFYNPIMLLDPGCLILSFTLKQQHILFRTTLSPHQIPSVLLFWLIFSCEEHVLQEFFLIYWLFFVSSWHSTLSASPVLVRNSVSRNYLIICTYLPIQSFYSSLKRDIVYIV